VTTDDTGAVQKCELCIQNSGGTPRCVQGCPNAAIVFEER
jgi:carbon-monoxide dehydrogenase iron sulfur subunit